MNVSLEYYLVQLRRIAEHREKGAEQEIQRIYKELLKDLQQFLGVEYARLAEDDRLTYEILQCKGEYARFLEEVELRINTLTPKASKEIQTVVEEVYELAYKGMIDAVQKSKTPKVLKENLTGVKGVTPEIVKRAVENPISGLTLKDTLEKNRKEIIYNIKREIGVGLTQGDRMSTMAKRISKQVDKDYRKAMTIARTEVHRVREGGFLDSAMEIEKTLQQSGSGIRMTKTWGTALDERVRPQRKAYKRKAGVKARKDHTAGLRSYLGGPNHVKMEGVTIGVDELFDLGGGVKTVAPGQSGVAGHDINCRCDLEYDLDIPDPVVDGKKNELVSKENGGKPEFTNFDTDDIIQSKEIIQDLMKLKASGMTEDEYAEYLGLLNNHTNASIRQIYAKYGDEIASIKKSANGGAYSRSLHTIDFSYPKYDDMNKYGTLAHEYGHFFDAQASFNDLHFRELEAIRNATGLDAQFKNAASSSDEFLEAIRKDKDYIRSIFTPDQKEDLLEHNASSGVQDAIDGLFTKSRIRWGHGEAYYNRRYSWIESMDRMAGTSLKKRLKQVYKDLGFDASSQAKVKSICRQYEAASEAWANIMSAEVCGGESLEYVKKYLPNSYQVMLEILKRVI